MRIFGDEIIEPIAPPTDPMLWWILGIVAAVAAITAVVIVILIKRKKGR
jgi:hypothetical protein